MRVVSNVRRARWFAIPIVLGIFSLLTVGYLSSFAVVRIQDDNRALNIRTNQSLVRDVLREAGITLHPEDTTIPALDQTLGSERLIQIRRARLVQFTVDDQLPRLLRTQSESARELLQQLGFNLTVNDYLTVNGEFTDQIPRRQRSDQDDASATLPDAEIVLRRSVSVTIQEGDSVQTLRTAARTVGEALLQAGYILHLADRVDPPPDTVIRPNLQIRLERAKPVTIWVDGRSVRTRTLRDTVGEVLAEMNIALLDEDYALPSLDAPVTPQSEIRVVRIRRELQVQQNTIPFETRWEPDPELELDTTAVAQEGAAGVRERRSLVTFEDGIEVKRTLVSDSIPVPPQPKINKYGTKIVIRTLDTPAGPVQYWRKIRMLATSYSASTAGVPRNSPWYGRTRCGEPMRFGIVAVDPRVIPLRSNVYVPDYGIGLACDTGSAIIGKRIDLGYDDNNLRLWYRWVDVYLLTPVPSNIRYRLD